MSHTNPDISRRRLLLGIAATAGGASVLGALTWTRGANATDTAVATKATGDQMVSIVMFDDHGQRVGEHQLPKVIKSDAQWQKQLSPEAYQVTRHAGTERPFSGDYNKPDKPGIYRCIGCDTALYDDATQFHSGTGWPSFWQPIAQENISEDTDTMFGMRRTEIKCKRCDAHLGHVFRDGPQPTGLRYCMNSVALRFKATGAA